MFDSNNVVTRYHNVIEKIFIKLSIFKTGQIREAQADNENNDNKLFL